MKLFLEFQLKKNRKSKLKRLEAQMIGRCAQDLPFGVKVNTSDRPRIDIICVELLVMMVRISKNNPLKI